MFKKLISSIMIMSIFMVQANASTHAGLKAAFDELNYAMTVEWDQKDMNFHAEQMKKFTATMRALQSKGLTNAQMIEFAKSEIKDAKAAKDLETAFNMIQINKMSPTEAQNYMTEAMKKSFSAGASWNGEVFIYLAVGLLIVALAVGVATGNTTVSGGGYYYDDCNCYEYCVAWDYYGCYMYDWSCSGYYCY